MDSSVEDRVDRAIAQVFGLAPGNVPPDMSGMTHDAWDSASYLVLVMTLEEQLGVVFSPEEIENALGRKDLIRIIESKLKA